MRINRITAYNFRQHKKLDLLFHKKDSNDLFIIIASNGMGKSNFLNAITWCLYGDEFHLAQKSKALPIVNVGELDKISTGKIITVNVSIEFEIGDSCYTIKRNKTFSKTGNKNKPIMETSHDISVLIDKDSKIYEKTGDQATLLINKIVPQAINQYFFFDNEQLEKYFTEKQAAESIKSSIHEISQVSLLTRIKNRLSTLDSEYTSFLGKSDPDIEGIRELYEAKNESIRVISKQIKQLENQNKDARIVIDECTLYLGTVGDIAELDSKATEYKKRIEELKNRRAERIIEKQTFIRKYIILLRLYPFLVETKKYIQKIDSKGSLPPKIDPTFLKSFLEEKHCLICNAPLNTDEKEHIENLIAKIAISSDSAQLLVSIQNDVLRLINETEAYPQEKARIFRLIDEVDKDIQNADKELQAINSSIEKCSDRERAIERYDTKKNNEELLKKNIENIKQNELYLKRLGDEANDLKIKLERSITKSSKNQKVREYKIFTEKLHCLFENMESEFITEMKKTMSDGTYRIFNEFAWKKNICSEVLIDAEYGIDVRDSRGYLGLGSLSKGELSLLALSYTLALHQISGFDGMLVIDTPVGRISDAHRTNFANVLRKVSEGKQIIMLFTPSEYSDEIRPIFEGAAQEYKITTYDEVSSEISEGRR